MRLGIFLSALLAGGCALKKPAQPVAVQSPVVGVPAKPAVPATPPPPIPPQANFLLTVSETVAQPQDDIGSFVRIFVDNRQAGETNVDARSVDKTWGAALPEGNHLFRFQKWELPDTGDWRMLDSQYQPPERFIRVKPGEKTLVRLRFYDNGFKNRLEIERQPLPQPQP